jgi:cytochrome c oxidase subunit 6a
LIHYPQAVTFLAIPVCAIKAFVDLSHGEHHGDEAPAYPYLRIRSKEFPWGEDGLFEVKHDNNHH